MLLQNFLSRCDVRYLDHGFKKNNGFRFGEVIVKTIIFAIN